MPNVPLRSCLFLSLHDVKAPAELLRRLWPDLRQGQAARQRVTARFASAFRPVAKRLEEGGQLVERERPMFALNVLLDETGLRAYWGQQDQGAKRLSRLYELGQLFGERDDGRLSPREALANLVHLAALGNEMDRYLESENKVLLLTAHQAKGLESDTVFIAGATDRQFPSLRSVREGRLSEEHRLFYVAMTRARCRLIISYHASNGDGKRQEASRFLNVLPSEVCQEL